MKQYELLDHTADAKFRAYGSTREEAFANAISALAAIVTDPGKMRLRRTARVAVQANDLKSLLFDLLAELIYRIDTEGFLAAKGDVTITKNDEGFVLVAIVQGDDVRAYGANLKAVTYSDMIVEEKDGIWTVQAVIDI